MAKRKKIKRNDEIAKGHSEVHTGNEKSMTEDGKGSLRRGLVIGSRWLEQVAALEPQEARDMSKERAPQEDKKQEYLGMAIDEHDEKNTHVQV